MTAHPLNIVVIAGGLTHERDISLRSGSRVANLLRHCGHRVTVADVDKQLLALLNSNRPDVVWPLVHGSVGEDGSLQDIFEAVGVPYVGTCPQGCRIASAKHVAKSVVAKNHLATPEAIAIPQELFQQLGALELLDAVSKHFDFPLMVKPAYGGSALGVTRVTNADQLRGAMVDALAYGQQVLIEKVVEGKEVSVSVVSDAQGQAHCLPVVEVETEDGRYDYDARYNAGRSRFFVPARLSEAELNECRQLALDCHRVLELRHYSRIDMILDAQGKAWFIDANVAPGMTDTSLLPLACQQVDSALLSAVLQIPEADADSLCQRAEVDLEVVLRVLVDHLARLASNK